MTFKEGEFYYIARIDSNETYCAEYLGNKTQYFTNPSKIEKRHTFKPKFHILV